MEVSQRRRQYRPHTQPSTARQVNLRIIFRVIAKHNFAAAQTFS
jgi:hypothetical protein